MTQNTDFGLWSEHYVAQYLEARGYSIITRNYRQKWGEIDIIAKKEGILVFTEVKANKQSVSGFEPENRVNIEKLRRIHRTIQTFLISQKYNPNQEYQIDIITLILDRSRGIVKIKHFKNIDT